MGWNGSGTSSARPIVEKKATRVAVSGKVKGLVAGLLVAVLGGAALFILMKGEERLVVKEKTPFEKTAIAEVVPSLATNAATVAKTKAVPEEEEYIEVNGKKIKLAADPKTGKPKYDKNVRIIPMRESDIKPKRFEFDAEEDIASLLEIEPGTPMYGEIPFGKRFKDSLVNSFMTPVEIKPTDDDYTKELKKQVQEVKNEFRELILNGGDPAVEMKKAREQLIELGQYRTTLLQEINKMRKSGEYSAQDVRDMQDAANKLLEEKGAKPIQLPAVLLRNMELKERRNQE